MKKKFSKSLLIAMLLSISVVGVVFAGSTLDYGQLATIPPVGEANYTVWFNNSANKLPEGMPYEIATEDMYNAQLGVDNGYSTHEDGTTIVWKLQANNLEYGKGHDQPISMIFGSLPVSSFLP